MIAEMPPKTSLPIGTVLLFGLTGVLYVVMLANISFSTGGGEDAFSQGVGALFAVTGLWVALALLLVVCALLGQMPRWSAIIAFIGIPLSAVATFVAVDMCSRHIAAAILVPIILPLLIGFNAAWALWPKIRAAFPDANFSQTVWGLIIAISLGTFLLAFNY